MMICLRVDRNQTGKVLHCGNAEPFLFDYGEERSYIFRIRHLLNANQSDIGMAKQYQINRTRKNA